MTGRAPAVSVIVTCFNYGRFVGGCLDSLVAQTFRDWEAVVVDDGSTDDSPRIVERYTDDPRIRMVRQANGGQARAKNAGVAATRGEFVAFLDADDQWEPGKLERQLPLFADPAVAVVFSRASYIDDEGRLVDGDPRRRELRPRRGEVTRDLFFDNFIPFSSSVLRRATLLGRPPFDESLSMGIDWDLWLRLSVDHRFDFVDERLLRYRLGHPGQMSKNLEVRQACSDRIMSGFVERYPEALPGSVVRRAWAYTHVNRGMYYRDREPRRAREHFWAAIRLRPLQMIAYKELVRMAAGRRGGRA